MPDFSGNPCHTTLSALDARGMPQTQAGRALRTVVAQREDAVVSAYAVLRREGTPDEEAAYGAVANETSVVVQFSGNAWDDLRAHEKWTWDGIAMNYAKRNDFISFR